jgi:DNA-binding transcriptional MerR regulator
MKPSPEPDNESRIYRSHEVVRRAKITNRQLQWWDEQRLVSPEQRGHARLYKVNEVLRVMIVAELRRKGYSLQTLQDFAARRFLNRIAGKDWKSIAEMLIVTDGKRLAFGAADDIIDILKNATTGLQLVSVADQIRAIEEYTSGPEHTVSARRTAHILDRTGLTGQQLGRQLRRAATA